MNGDGSMCRFSISPISEGECLSFQVLLLVEHIEQHHLLKERYLGRDNPSKATAGYD
jgi:hypothetical protein